MLQIWKTLRGRARVELQGPEPLRLLERCRREGLRLERVSAPDPWTLRLELEQGELETLRRTAEGLGFSLRVLRLRGGRAAGRKLRRRWALLAGLLLAALLLTSSRLFVWQLRVQGCERLTPGEVLRALAECGVEPGTFAPGIRQDLVRSRMLTLLPELEWCAVNVSGSRAAVLVRERRETPELRRQGPADIRAERSGLIRSMTVLEGLPAVEPGDAVLEGELLVSGTVESLSRPPRELRAMAEVRAETWRELIAVCPLDMLQTGVRSPTGKSRGLRLGKNLLYPGGNPAEGLDECDIIVHDSFLGAEGLFSLPLGLQVRERAILLPDGGQARREEEMKQALLRRLQAEIRGEILDWSFSVGKDEALLIVSLRAHCLEDIAQTAEKSP